jgi:hypothetical protein
MPTSERCPGQPREALMRAKAGFRQELGKECDCSDDVGGFYRTLHSKGQANVTGESTREITKDRDSAGNLVTTIDKGEGTLSGVTDGTRTVSTHTKHDTLIKEIVSDIASGVVLSTREAIAFDANDQVTRWAYDNDLDDFSETLNGCCGIDSTRSRDGIVTTYTRDGLKRPKTATSQGITLTYTYGTTTIGGTVFPS